MPSDRFFPDTATLEEFFGLGSSRLVVPTYQRRYAWNHKQEVAQLWQDLQEAHESNEDEYFLGTLVLNKTAPREAFEIIDGQQRLATLTMMLAALRNKLASLGQLTDASRASSKLHDLIMRTDLRGRPEDAVLTLGRYDQESFRRYVQLRPGDTQHLAVDANIAQGKPGRPPKNRVRDAFKQIGDLADEFVLSLSPKEQVDGLAGFAQYLLSHVTLMIIRVKEDTDAFMLFETVNYRGLDLSTADLLKNHLFGLASEHQIEHLIASWDTFVGSLEDQHITRFLRYFWLSHHEHVTEKQLYRRIKERMKSSSIDPLEFLNDLNDEASIFAALADPRDDDPCALELKDLFAMHMTQGTPFLLAAKGELDEKSFRQAVLIVETLSLRNTVVAGKNPNELEKHFGRWARQLRESPDVSQIADEARKLLIKDDEFVRGFHELSELKSPQARYILRKIEFVGNKETRIASAGVDIEHILPQNPGQDWIEAIGGSEDEVRATSQRLGNLTLLNERLNKGAAAKPFDKKRDEYYSKSKFAMTLGLCSLDEWTADSISARQTEFAERAKEIWRL